MDAAGQLNDPPRWLQITNWVRARTASEALKHDAYKYAASVTPYIPLKRDAALNSERERIERDVDDLLASAVSSAKAGSAPRNKLLRDEYVASPVCAQIERFYLPKANANRKIAASTIRFISSTVRAFTKDRIGSTAPSPIL
jgi:hypothetical protein